MTLVHYAEIAEAVEPTGMLARGGFVTDALGTIVVIGNVGGAMWERFERERPDVDNPLDTWTRAVLRPIAESLGAGFVHPSDEPYQPFQRWAQRADDVFPSPIGLLIHPDHGLWHAYRGAFLFDEVVEGLPETGCRDSPCASCADRPCLTTCPVGAFTDPDAGGGYDATSCRAHVRSGAEPDCMHDGCAARRACPVGAAGHYGPAQMELHMRAFVQVVPGTT